MRILAIIFSICFILSAAVQYNDPDPAIWVTIYLLGAVASFLFIRNVLPSWGYLLLGLAYLVGAITQWPPEFEGFLFGEVQKMRNMNIELARESFGLGIVAVAMFMYWLSARRRSIS
jgi:hypothetical protein